jgi:peptidoglycan-associated lipoprotein
MLRPVLSKIAAIALTLTLAACGSSVKLSDVPVEDRTGTSTGAGAGAGAGAGVSSGAPGGRAVAPVDLAPNAGAAAGPVGVARVVYFDYDSFVVKPEFQALIEGHARFLNADKSRRILIEGHTDERGGREYNLALGQKRAEAVRRALGLLGVSDAQVEPVSFGKEKPAVQGASEEALAKNRRAEINYR